jgi:thymidylate synthase (FAD)
MIVELLSITPVPETLIEMAGRICYKSEPKGNPQAFIAKRIEQGHESILEHASATFKIWGISRACSHQIVRHRIASYSQQSQRYVDMRDCGFVMPDTIKENDGARQIWYSYLDTVQDTYKGLRDMGIPKEDARFILPNATYTELIMTMNFRSLRNLFSLRLDKHAQWEIREVAKRMLLLLLPHSPSVFSEFEAML